MPLESRAEKSASASAPHELADAAIRAQLERVLASDVFSRSPQLRRFLSFVVEQSLTGQGHTLKESVLAHELYGKGTDFDGGSDPVVRVDARRLRDKLREYYDDRFDPIVISLPKGSYVPVFEGKSTSPTPLPRLIPRSEPQEKAPATRVSRTRLRIGALAVIAVIVVVLTVLVAWFVSRSSSDAPSQLLPLASYPGSEGWPALSPDGDLVAFAWSGGETGPTDIYVKAVGSEALRRVTDTPESERDPAWSPDGRSIAFAREGSSPDRRGVFTISQLGGAERQVSASGTNVAWSRDSKSVLIRDRDANVGPFGFYQVFLDTLKRRQLTQAPLGDGDWRADVSPDGKTLAFIRYQRSGIADLYVVPMEGGEPRRLSNWNTSIWGLSWTADGSEIVYSVWEPPSSRLWRINALSPQPNRGSPLPDIPWGAEGPSISRPTRGQPARLAFQTITRDADLHMMDLEASLVKDTIPSTPFSNSTRFEASARFSPDGNRIAFNSYRSGGPEIWVAGRNGSGLRQITSLGAEQLFVSAWSPDGADIAFDAAIGGNSDVYLVGADGGRLRRLTSESSVDGIPSWSGDGRWIYFVSTRGGVIPNVWRIPADGGEATRITHKGGFEPKESPDGRFLFYLDGYPAGLRATGTARVIRVPLGGGEAQVVLDHVQPFLWSVAVTGIVFVTRGAEFDAIDTYRFDDRRVTRVGRLGFRVPTIFTHMAVSPDGRWALVTNLVRSDSDLMLLDKFR
jgi:Tol biopolymer transport system component